MPIYIGGVYANLYAFGMLRYHTYLNMDVVQYVVYYLPGNGGAENLWVRIRKRKKFLLRKIKRI